MNGEAQDKAGGTAQNVPVKEEPDPWTKEHLFLLLDQMKALLPENDNFRYKTTEYNMDWEKLKIGDFTSQTCRQRWSQLSTKVRKFRTLSELLFDAKEYLKNPYKGMKIQNHPDFPKKPLTPYLRFYLLKRKKFAKIHPQLNNLDLTRMLSQTYKDMPERKRVKYIEEYRQEKESFDKAMIKFWEEHPDLVEMAPPKSDLPEKPKTPQQLWFLHEKKVSMKQHPEMNPKDVKDNLRRQWSLLPDKKRLKWINKTLEMQKEYKEVLREYLERHPDFASNDLGKSVLSKAERMLKDKHDGRPSKPPFSLRVLLRRAYWQP
uniref:nucleolar transcription factor 1-B-like n=1 Tax=Myxine glutinosa TaxID=7769 RepID=UPI0035902567